MGKSSIYEILLVGRKAISQKSSQSPQGPLIARSARKRAGLFPHRKRGRLNCVKAKTDELIAKKMRTAQQSRVVNFISAVCATGGVFCT